VRSPEEWSMHPQGLAVAELPLLERCHMRGLFPGRHVRPAVQVAGPSCRTVIGKARVGWRTRVAGPF
jgi:hypothetical protein